MKESMITVMQGCRNVPDKSLIDYFFSARYRYREVKIAFQGDGKTKCTKVRSSPGGADVKQYYFVIFS